MRLSSNASHPVRGAAAVAAAAALVHIELPVVPEVVGCAGHAHVPGTTHTSQTSTLTHIQRARGRASEWVREGKIKRRRDSAQKTKSKTESETKKNKQK